MRPPRFLIRFFWGNPLVFRWLGKARYSVDVFDSNYDIAFDGFARSGNTYGSRMISVTQHDRVKVLTHTHLPPYLIRGLQLNKPVCLTLRNPEDSIVSFVLFSQRPIDRVIKSYIDFYRVMLPHRERLLVLPFPVITRDFATVLRLINYRFGMKLEIPKDPSVYEKEVFERIDHFFTNEPGGYHPLRVGRPHPEREAKKAEIHALLTDPRHATLLKECHELYDTFEAEYRIALREMNSANKAPHDADISAKPKSLPRDASAFSSYSDSTQVAGA